MKKAINLSKESTTERNILKYLNSLPNTKAVKWSQEGRQKGNPDIICCNSGLLILIEVKREGELQELLQVVTMEEWARAGAITCVVTCLGHIQELMEYILTERAEMFGELKGMN